MITLPRRTPGATLAGRPADATYARALSAAFDVRGQMWDYLGTEDDLHAHAHALMCPTWPGDDPLTPWGPNARRLGRGARIYLATVLLAGYAKAHPQREQHLTIAHIAHWTDEATGTFVSLGAATTTFKEQVA
jgi:hypothetical protein